MSVHEALVVPYHQQNSWNYCGPACSQMVLAGLGGGLLSQDDLFDDIQAHNIIETDNWWSAPDGIMWTLNNHPTTSAAVFNANVMTSADAISRSIVWSIHSASLPAVALVAGMQHWIVILGYQASAAPSDACDTSYSISSFDCNNPCPAVPDPPEDGYPPPHSDTDGCGSGGTHGAGDENIAYAQWTDTYMTGVRSGAWQGFVAVCNPVLATLPAGTSRPARHQADGSRLLRPEEIASFALAALKNSGLADHDAWKKSLAGTTPGQPILVQRLDRTDKFYYIAPMETGPGVASVLVCIDARFGDYLQALRVSGPRGNAYAGLSFDAPTALAKVLGKRFAGGKQSGRLIVRPEAFALYPTLVWKMCRESRSPYYPFFMITVGNQRIYVRVDGQVFTRLHVHDRGI